MTKQLQPPSCIISVISSTRASTKYFLASGYLLPKRSESEVGLYFSCNASNSSRCACGIFLTIAAATSRLTIPADYRFRSTKKGIATHIYYERQGKKVDDFSDAEADNYIELNGIKSELVIVEAEV